MSIVIKSPPIHKFNELDYIRALTEPMFCNTVDRLPVRNYYTGLDNELFLHRSAGIIRSFPSAFDNRNTRTQSVLHFKEVSQGIYRISIGLLICEPYINKESNVSIYFLGSFENITSNLKTTQFKYYAPEGSGLISTTQFFRPLIVSERENKLYNWLEGYDIFQIPTHSIVDNSSVYNLIPKTLQYLEIMGTAKRGGLLIDEAIELAKATNNIFKSETNNIFFSDPTFVSKLQGAYKEKLLNYLDEDTWDFGSISDVYYYPVDTNLNIPISVFSQVTDFTFKDTFNQNSVLLKISGLKECFLRPINDGGARDVTLHTPDFVSIIDTAMHSPHGLPLRCNVSSIKSMSEGFSFGFALDYTHRPTSKKLQISVVYDYINDTATFTKGERFKGLPIDINAEFIDSSCNFIKSSNGNFSGLLTTTEEFIGVGYILSCIQQIRANRY